ncbi:hypothetical protein [Snodgrassella sp. CFCC 13594]|uniref:hypothetical protein n=1 Tax=Snodgrassella sp. CFCC 13594 TaxID=1775559 RepID=UPI000B1FA9BF|nr:hypothetical protein [Snodgrassella sp. CFCC 13594]
MAVKVYIAKIGLVLTNADGSTFRVGVGEAVELTPEQYKTVSAYVDEGHIKDADLAASGYQPDGETPTADDNQKPKSNRGNNKPAAAQAKE